MSGLGLTDAATNLLNQVRNLFGADNVVVTSGRSSRVGVAGGSPTSQHPSGNAFDFHVTGYTPDQVQSVLAGSGISFGQSIQEYGAAAGAGLNHLGVGTKGQLLTGNNGKYTTTGYAAATGAPVVGGGRSYLQSILGSTIGNGISDTLTSLGGDLAAPGDALFGGSSLSDWFQRVALGLLAILLIGAALFMLAGKPAIEIAGKVPPLPA